MVKRGEVRYQVQCPVDFVLDGKAGQGVIFNLSRIGCAIESEFNAISGDPVSLNIAVPSQPTPVSIDLGKVRWATRREVGVEFLVVPASSQQRLDEFLIAFAKQMAAS